MIKIEVTCDECGTGDDIIACYGCGDNVDLKQEKRLHLCTKDLIKLALGELSKDKYEYYPLTNWERY